MHKLTRLSFIGALLGGMALFAWWKLGEDLVWIGKPGVAVEPGSEKSSPSLPTGTAEQAVHAPQAAPVRAGTGGTAPRYSADSIYATLVRLHAEKQPGSWGSMYHLMVQCFAADLSVAASKAALSTPAAMSDPLFSQRSEAVRKLESKCENMPVLDYLVQFQPRNDDADGKKFLAATQALRDRRPGYSFGDVEAAVREIARQGRLDIALGYMPVPPHAVGRHWSGSDDGLAAARWAAIELATAEPGREHEDIRLLERCARFGRCDFQYGAVHDSVPAQEREEARRLAEDLAQAIRRGDVDALFGRQGR